MRSLKSMGKTKSRNSVAETEVKTPDKKANSRTPLLKQTMQDRAIDYIKTGNIEGLVAMNAEGSTETVFVNRFHTKSGMHPLAVAADEMRIDAIELLLKAGAEINLKDENGMVALHYAAMQGDEEIVERLIKAEADVEVVKDSTNETPAHFAAKNKHTKVVKLLDFYLSPMDRLDKRYETPLSISLKLENYPLCDFLLTRDCNIDTVNESLDTPLLKSAFDGRINSSKYIIEHGGNIAHKNMNGNTALMIACRHGNLPLIQLLLDKGANINEVDSTGKTALVIAIMTDKIAVVKLLLANEHVDINLADQWQFTPLMFACISKPINMDIITLLLAKGCDVNVQDKAYNTALSHACKQNHFPAIKALLRNGANIHLSNIDNETPEKVLISEEDRKAFRAEVSVVQPDALRDFKDPNKKPHWINILNATNKTNKK